METSRTLIQALGLERSDEDWQTFFDLYEPLIEIWLRRYGVNANDVADLSQEVFLTLANDLPNFQHNGNVGAFRKWLRVVTLNRCRRYWAARKKQSVVGFEAARELFDELESPESALAQRWDLEHDQHVLRKLLQTVRADFTETTLTIFQRTAIGGEDAKTVADDLSIKVGQVYKAKFRVMTRLQQDANRIFNDVAELLTTRRKR